MKNMNAKHVVDIFVLLLPSANIFSTYGIDNGANIPYIREYNRYPQIEDTLNKYVEGAWICFSPQPNFVGG